MVASGRGSGMVGYNVQVVVDTEHHLIVAHYVTQCGHDRRQLYRMAKQAKTAIGVDRLEVVADRCYFKVEEVLACERDNITNFLLRPFTSNIIKKGIFNKQDFIYRSEDEEYEYPGGERLIYRFTAEEKGHTLH